MYDLTSKMWFKQPLNTAVYVTLITFYTVVVAFQEHSLPFHVDNHN